MKKLKRDKFKGEDAINPDILEVKKHKKKHRCNDVELCKHRKHKKKRKHKKHHRDEILKESTGGVSVSGPEDDGSREDDGRTYEIVVKEPIEENVMEEEDDIDEEAEEEEDDEEEEEEEEEEDDEVIERFEALVRDETFTEEDIASSVTESSDSFYVSILNLPEQLQLFI